MDDSDPQRHPPLTPGDDVETLRDDIGRRGWSPPVQHRFVPTALLPEVAGEFDALVAHVKAHGYRLDGPVVGPSTEPI